MREDYSDGGDAWSYFTHDQARSRAYRWGEDGLAGISDDKQRLCLAVALWNGRDPIIKERLFGLTNAEGNHGEDVKEYYFYLDNLPTHSYQRYLYKYPQEEFPYNELVTVNGQRSRHELEYELADTGIFDGQNYFDVEVEHAKAAPEDIVCRITVHNRSARDAETNVARVFGPGHEPRTRYPKDGIADHVLHQADTVNPAGTGTKAAAHVRLDITPPAVGDDARAVMRQALAGMLWSKQCSACSTGAPHCRPVGGLSRPTGPPGWPCSARTARDGPDAAGGHVSRAQQRPAGQHRRPAAPRRARPAPAVPRQ
ncbi:MAG TPA: hypothetical protein VIZ43_03810 [Trebonia sp.]